MSAHTIAFNANDLKSMVRAVRDSCQRILDSPGARNVQAGEKKIRFYDWCLAREDCWEKFEAYCDAKRAASGNEEVGFRAAGWADT